MFSEKIRLLREKKGLTQEEVAEYLHISRSAYARMEQGKSNSWAPHVEQLCGLFDISAGELFSTDQVVLNQNKGDHSHGGCGYIINYFLSEKLIDQYEARIAEKDAALDKQESMINELREQLKKESRKP